MNADQRKIHSRLDRQAIDQLRAEVARLYEELEEARYQLSIAERNAYAWQEDADHLREVIEEMQPETGCGVGLTQSGRLVVVGVEGSS